MYKNKKSSDNTRLFFVAAAGIMCVLILVGVIVSHGALFQRIDPKDTTTPYETPKIPSLTDRVPGENTDTDTEPATTPEDTEPQPPATDPVTDPVTEPPVTEPPATDPVSSYIPDAPPTGDYILGKTPDAGIEYQDKIVFLGDSTTYSLLYYGALSGGKESTQIWTPKSRTLALDMALTTTILYPETEEEITIEEAARRKQPEIMVITLGVNGVSYMHDKEDFFISVYTKLVNKIKNASPNTKIILQSIYPVARNWEKTKSINNERIRAANVWIRTVAQDCGVYYLDTISVLEDEEGFLPEAYQNGDGIHFNAHSCGIVLEYIRTHALPGYTEE